MKAVLALACILISSVAFAHPAGTYILNGDKEATLTIKKVAACPVVQGALKGNLKAFTFSEVAVAAPYSFTTGLYVEVHVDEKEVYVQTDDSCVPVPAGMNYEASKTTFGGYSLEKQ